MNKAGKGLALLGWHSSEKERESSSKHIVCQMGRNAVAKSKAGRSESEVPVVEHRLEEVRESLRVCGGRRSGKGKRLNRTRREQHRLQQSH